MKKALVVIDVQKYFMNRDTKKIPGKIASYIRKNGGKFDQIVFFKFVNNKDTPFYKFYEWKDMMGPPETDLCPEIEEISSGKKLFVKDTRSCLRNHNFLGFLRKNGVGELYLCGLNTDECVLVTALDGFDCGFNIFILKDLCSSMYGKENHRDALVILKKQFKLV